MKEQKADICMICEGSYPYSTGGVAQWMHELIQAQQEKTFHILSLAPPHPDLEKKYNFPKNVIGHTTYILQDLPQGSNESHAPSDLWGIIHNTLTGLIQSKTFKDFEPIFETFTNYSSSLGKKILLESPAAWDQWIRIYDQAIPSGPFKASFATLYTLSCSLYSVLLPPLPQARLYHAVCTGYAGFLLYRAKWENKAPCLLTEHGIYSNERRIEIAMADWIAEMGSLNLDLENKTKTLKDFWLNAFFSMAHVAYLCSDAVITTFDGNQEIQIEGGADPKITRTIVHGIDPAVYATITKQPHQPSVAFVGRIVPIKDVKSFIRACALVKQAIPEINFYLLGPTEEDPAYAEECRKLIRELRLEADIELTGKINFKDYLPKIDIIVLTSISEAQPLVMLEAGAVGIPIVATAVGACEQIIYGSQVESPNLGAGGILTPLVNPKATAEAVIKLLKDKNLYQSCSTNIKKRIETYYRAEQEQSEYKTLYDSFLQKGK